MQHIDLNLLVALDALLSEASVSRAAGRLYLSAAATSHALARLRIATGDPLLVRSGKSMSLTPHAIELRAPVSRVVSEAKGLLATSRSASLTQMKRRFIVRAPDGVAIIYGPAMIKALQVEMPLASLKFVAEGEYDTMALRDGRIDLDIGPLRSREPDTQVEQLFEQDYVGAVTKQHNFARGKITLRRFLEQQHVSVAQPDGIEDPVDTALRRQHLQRTIALTVPSAYGALVAASQTAFIAIVPKRVALVCANRLGLKIFTLPLDVTSEATHQAWHTRLQLEPAHQYLRNVVRAVLCQTGQHKSSAKVL